MMHRANNATTTPKALQIKQKQEGINGVGDQSFRVLYYGNASAGSVPFMWESQPGTPKHALTESSLPPLTPPPSYHQFSPTYNSTMQLINHHSSSSKRSGFLRTIFLASSRKTNTTAVAPPPSFSCSSISSSSSSSVSSSHLYSASSTPMSKTEARRMMSVVKFGLEDDGDDGGSPTSTLCLGGGFKKSYRIKKMKNAMLSFVSHGKA